MHAGPQCSGLHAVGRAAIRAVQTGKQLQSHLVPGFPNVGSGLVSVGDGFSPNYQQTEKKHQHMEGSFGVALSPICPGGRCLIHGGLRKTKCITSESVFPHLC